MSDTPASLKTPPEGYGEWLADLRSPAELQTNLPSIEQIECELAGDGTLMEDESQ